MEEQPLVVWCGGCNNGQDISIRLVLHGLSAKGSQADDHPMGEEALAVLKVHSSQLRRNSKYFETCLSERWREQGAGASDARLEFSLEANADVACYTDCFSRMYSPSRRDFRDVEYGLELLRVASQIEYHELMDCISQYLSAIRWSDEDERKIREYASSPDFSRNHAEDLVSRLGLDVDKAEHQQRVSDYIRQAMLFALRPFGSIRNRKFIEELIECIQVGNDFAEDVIGIIINAAKERFLKFDSDCLVAENFTEVEYFAQLVSGMCWILRLLIDTGVAEGLVHCLVRLKWIPQFLSIEESVEESNAGWDLATIVVQIYKEVVAGRLLLRRAQRVALIKKWHVLVELHLEREEYSEAIKDLFLTLAPEDQIELLEVKYSVDFIDARPLATLITKHWPAKEENSLAVIKGKHIGLYLNSMQWMWTLSSPCGHIRLLVAADVFGSPVQIPCWLVHGCIHN